MGSMQMRKDRTFTLLELLVVVTIMAILVSMLLPSLAKARSAAKDAVCLSNLKQIGQAYVGYASQNSRFYPAFAKYKDLRMNGGDLDNRYYFKSGVNALDGRQNNTFSRPLMSVLSPFFGGADGDLEEIRLAYTCPHVEAEVTRKFINKSGYVKFPYYSTNSSTCSYSIFPNWYRDGGSHKAWAVKTPMRLLGEPWQLGNRVGDRSSPWSHVLASDVIANAGNGSKAPTRYYGGLPRYQVNHLSPTAEIDKEWRLGGTGKTRYGTGEYAEFEGFFYGANGSANAWIQIGLQVRANYLSDDGSARIRKGMDPRLNFNSNYTYSIPEEYTQEDR